MVLKMADLVKCWESFQTPWNAPNMLGNWFPTTFGLIHGDLLWIPNGTKSTNFEQKAWAIAHGFEDGGFGQVLGIVPNSLKRPQYAWKLISNYFRAHSWRFTLNSEWPEIDRFWAKSLGCSPWFWRWRIWSSAGNPSKLPETPQYAWKLISNYFRAHSLGFTLNSEWPEIDQFWAKSLGYSPWFWRWRIWSSPGNRCKLPETPPMCLEIDFQLHSGSFMEIYCEFRMARNRPILSKKPGL